MYKSKRQKQVDGVFSGCAIIIILTCILFSYYGFFVPYKTETMYVENMTWNRSIYEKYNVTECGWRYNSDGDYVHSCDTVTKTAGQAHRSGTIDDKPRWPEYTKKRNDSSLTYEQRYNVIFLNDKSRVVLSICDENDWRSTYKIESLHIVTTSLFGNILEIKHK